MAVIMSSTLFIPLFTTVIIKGRDMCSLFMQVITNKNIQAKTKKTKK